MTDKRYVQFEFPYDDFAVKDNKTNEELWNPKVVDRLNEQEERIKELQQTINTIAKDYEYSHGMDIRNAEWFTAW